MSLLKLKQTNIVDKSGKKKKRKSVFFLTSVCPTSGFVIVGEDNTGKLDLGIFIASIVPDGPADKDGRIKPGLSHRQARHKVLYVCWLAGRNLQ